MRKVEIIPQTDFWGFEISSKLRALRSLKEHKISINCTYYNLVESLISINFIFNTIYPQFWFILWKFISKIEL